MYAILANALMTRVLDWQIISGLISKCFFDWMLNVKKRVKILTKYVTKRRQRRLIYVLLLRGGTTVTKKTDKWFYTQIPNLELYYFVLGNQCVKIDKWRRKIKDCFIWHFILQTEHWQFYKEKYSFFLLREGEIAWVI